MLGESGFEIAVVNTAAKARHVKIVSRIDTTSVTPVT